jgi:hypothetical protein
LYDFQQEGRQWLAGERRYYKERRFAGTHSKDFPRQTSRLTFRLSAKGEDEILKDAAAPHGHGKSSGNLLGLYES